MKTIAEYGHSKSTERFHALKRGHALQRLINFRYVLFMGQNKKRKKKGLNPNPPDQLKMSSLAFLDPVEPESEESLAWLF